MSWAALASSNPESDLFLSRNHLKQLKQEKYEALSGQRLLQLTGRTAWVRLLDRSHMDPLQSLCKANYLPWTLIALSWDLELTLPFHPT